MHLLAIIRRHLTCRAVFSKQQTRLMAIWYASSLFRSSCLSKDRTASTKNDKKTSPRMSLNRSTQSLLLELACAARRALPLVSWLAHLPRWVLEGMTCRDAQHAVSIADRAGDAIISVLLLKQNYAPPHKLNVSGVDAVCVCSQRMFSFNPLMHKVAKMAT